MASLTQILPYAVDESLDDHYENDCENTIQVLSQVSQGLLLDIYPSHIHNPYPIGITLISFYMMKKVVEVIERAIVKIVQNYFHDTRIHEHYLKLTLQAVNILKKIEGKPYEVGSWRPDILFPKNSTDSFVICEINARYPFNGYYASHFKNSTLSSLPHLKNLPIMPIQELEGVLNAFDGVFDSSKPVGILKSLSKDKGWDVNLFKRLYGAHDHQQRDESEGNTSELDNGIPSLSPLPPPPPPVLAREPSFPQLPTCKREFSETFNVHEDLARFINPIDLILGDDGQLYDQQDQSGLHPTPIDQFALEISQEELLALPEDVLEAIMLRCKYINDIRTIFITHDKRLLSILSCPDIMNDYLSPEDVNLLQRHIIKTFICGCHLPNHLAAVRRAKESREKWLLKPNGGGKGIGIIFGKDCRSDQEWIDILEDPKHANFILQEVVDQQVYSIYAKRNLPKTNTSLPHPHPHPAAAAELSKPQFHEMFVVGLLHCFNNKFLGPGIFRASSLESPIVNVAGGKGVILSPVILSCRWPLVRLDNGLLNHEKPRLMFQPPSHCIFDFQSGAPKEEICGDIIRTLHSDGIALVHPHWKYHENFEVEINNIFINFVQSIGGVPHPHSLNENGQDYVWDVRPVVDPNDAKEGQPRPARSLTAEAFEMHTDCSFENPPPRYMCLYVVREDRKGGGHSLLLDTEVLTRYLSRSALKILTTTEFVMNVPDEFKKGQETVTGKLIWDGGLWRYRSDLIIRETCSPVEVAALEELDRLLSNPHLLLATDLPGDSILVLDNSRWMHGRTVIFDHDRWLKRIRYHPLSPPPPCLRIVSRSKSLRIEEENDLCNKRVKKTNK